jgi:hypothetical protein
MDGTDDKLKSFRVRLRTIGAFSFLEEISQKLNAVFGLGDLFRDRGACLLNRGD